MRTERVLRLVDFALWVLAASTVAVVVSGALGFLIGDGLVGAKYGTFVAGFLLFGLGSLLIQPGRTGDDALEGISGDASPEHEYEARLQEVGPLADEHLPYADRVSRDWKIFATSIVVLLVSLALEVVFQVGP